jgi:hypothetical protein
MKRIFAAVLAASCAWGAGAVERRELGAVPVTGLVAETQQTDQEGEGLALVWWVPTEFWQAALQRDTKPEELAEIREAFADYLLIGVVEGTEKALGVVEFSPRESVLPRLHVSVDGVTFEPVAKARKEAQLLLDMMKPVLSSMMGELGALFHLVLLSSEKRKAPSGYDTTKLRITLDATKGADPRAFEFVGPLDTLHVPRRCPGGRDAHISWKYCPWDGTKLPD